MTPECYLALRTAVMADGYGREQVHHYKTCRFPASAVDLAEEMVWVIIGSGITHKAARNLEPRVLEALRGGRSAFTVYRNRRKADAMDYVWARQNRIFRTLKRAHRRGDIERIERALDDIPFLRGPALSRHLMKNIGFDVAKPDIHLKRIARHCGESVEGLCARLAAATGDRVAVVDVVLFLAAGPLRLIDSDDPATWAEAGHA